MALYASSTSTSIGWANVLGVPGSRLRTMSARSHGKACAPSSTCAARGCAGSYLLEKSTCEQLGITLIDFKIRSRVAPAREDIKAAAELFRRIEYPMLLHCKSGADRAGLMSVLYRFLEEGVPLMEAKQELSLRYGHSRQWSAGILDHFFERYIEDNRRRPIHFLDWIEKVYDPQELQHSFRDWGSRRSNRVHGRQ
jgi:protein tyrosine/serine phosphatase